MADEPYELEQHASRSALKLTARSDTMADGINPNVNRMFTSGIPLGVDELKELFIKRAESCHKRYQLRRTHRTKSLQIIYDQMGRPDNLVVMLYCKDFFPLFENWLASCDEHQIEVRQKLITFTLDQEAHDKTRKLGINTYFLNPDIYVGAGGSSAYGDRAFANTMFYKNAIVLDTLELGANVLFQDVDMLWLRDPFDYLSSKCQDQDLCIMYDGPNRIFKPLYANTGFIYATCTDASKALFETAFRNTATILQTRSHQVPFNKILTYFALHNVLSLKVLPQTLFLNGHLFNRVAGLNDIASNWKDEGYVVHYSWTANRQEKRDKIEKFGFNYLPGEQLLESLD